MLLRSYTDSFITKTDVKNHFLMFSIDNSIFMLMFILTNIVKKLILFKQPKKISSFLDLCSVANISLLVFDSKFHCFYLHGVNLLIIRSIHLVHLKQICKN